MKKELSRILIAGTNSGCGKTTLLRMIAGLETPDEGEIWLDDTCVFSKERRIDLPPEKRGLGFVFQDFALWPHMTVFENVAFGLRLKKLPEETIRPKVLEMLETVGLRGFERRSINQLSGGYAAEDLMVTNINVNPVSF